MSRSASRTPHLRRLHGHVTPTITVDTSVTFKQNAPAPGCPGGVAAANGHCFKAVPTLATYQGARDACKAQGGMLAEIGSADENQTAVRPSPSRTSPAAGSGHPAAGRLQPLPVRREEPVPEPQQHRPLRLEQRRGALQRNQDWAAGQPQSPPFTTGALVAAKGPGPR